MSNITSHLKMIGDRYRTEAYKKAVLMNVRRDDVVMDIGTGTGILAFFALQAGARKVYAVELSDIIEVAKKIAKDNNLQDRIEFIRGDSREIEINERVDVLITETIGNLGIDEGILDILYDGRERFLKPGGRIIPHGLNIRSMPVTMKEGHPFLFLKDFFHDMDFSHLSLLASNNFYKFRSGRSLKPEPLAGPSSLLSIDLYTSGELTLPVEMRTDFTITSRGHLHGALVYPEIILTEEMVISLWNNERFLPSNWAATFFPIGEIQDISKGDRLNFRLRFDKKHGITWQYSINDKNKRKVFSQTSMFGLPSLKRLFEQG